VQEAFTYVRLPTGKTVPEPNKFSDLLMAWLIAQQTALLLPVRRRKPKGRRRGDPYGRRDSITGY
jgi:hypothetical protein